MPILPSLKGHLLWASLPNICPLCLALLKEDNLSLSEKVPQVQITSYFRDNFSDLS